MSERERILGSYDRGRPGPLIIALGGVHGNEPSGIEAARRVLRRLQVESLPLRGRYLALAGNVAALKERRRFLALDLNRIWSEEAVRRLQSSDPARDLPEQREQRELLAVIETAAAEAPGPVVLLDLHSYSAPGAPFNTISDTLPSRRIAQAMPLPLILGIEEFARGTLNEYMEQRGRAAVAVEGGQHDDPQTVFHHEAAIWLTLVAAGAIPRSSLPELERLRLTLRRAARGRPQVAEIVFRYPFNGRDHFSMLPGFSNFDRVWTGDLLATDATAEIRSPRDGLLLLPLYQEQGSEGFYVGRPVGRFWLYLSSLLRRLKADRALPLLPGVRRHRHRPEVILVDPGLARWFNVQLFHLCGFRRLDNQGPYLAFIRRREA